MKKITKKLFLSLVILVTIISAMPAWVFAQQTGPTSLNYSGWVQCDGVVSRDAKGVPLEQDRTRECNFASLISMIKYLINWVFGISIPVIIGLLTYSGFLYMTGKEANIKQAKAIMQKAVTGFIVMLMAWFIVSTILKAVLDDSFKNVAGTLIETQ